MGARRVRRLARRATLDAYRAAARRDGTAAGDLWAARVDRNRTMLTERLGPEAAATLLAVRRQRAAIRQFVTQVAPLAASAALVVTVWWFFGPAAAAGLAAVAFAGIRPAPRPPDPLLLGEPPPALSGCAADLAAALSGTWETVPAAALFDEVIAAALECTPFADLPAELRAVVATLAHDNAALPPQERFRLGDLVAVAAALFERPAAPVG